MKPKVRRPQPRGFLRRSREPEVAVIPAGAGEAVWVSRAVADFQGLAAGIAEHHHRQRKIKARSSRFISKTIQLSAMPTSGCHFRISLSVIASRFKGCRKAKVTI